MFISNTATAAMMLPIGLSVAYILNDQNANESNSKVEGNHLLKKSSFSQVLSTKSYL
jgi:di/tricarboxylate transporter